MKDVNLYKEYFKQHGDPATNRTGHYRSSLEGRDVVMMPGSGVGTITRRNTKAAQMIEDLTPAGGFEMTGGLSIVIDDKLKHVCVAISTIE